jgi:PIN domain nuclease of toxin-antitoxin system
MIVLDTQALLWWLHDPSRLSAPARKRMQQAESGERMLVSAISVWEIAVKCRLGKLTLPMEIGAWYQQAEQYPGLTFAPVTPADAIASTLLPGEFHADPADRIIVAVARRLGTPLITSDDKIRAYAHVQTVW